MNPLVSPLSCMPLARLVAASMAAGNRAIIVDDTTTPPLIGNDPYVVHNSPAIVTERREIDHDAIAAAKAKRERKMKARELQRARSKAGQSPMSQWRREFGRTTSQ